MAKNGHMRTSYCRSLFSLLFLLFSLGPVAAHSVLEENQRLRMVISEQENKFRATLEEDHSRAETYAVRIELNVIKRLEGYSQVMAENRYYGDRKLKREYERYQNCWLAAEDLINHAKSIVRVLRDDLKDYDVESAVRKYNGHLADCDRELGL